MTIWSATSPSHDGAFRRLMTELRPRGKLLTPFNVVTVLLVAATLVILTVRFAFGLGSVTNLDQSFPWGLWIGFDVMAGVALAGGAYVLTFLVYVLRLEQYRPIVRVTVLNGFLAYVFYAGALVLDLGRPWHVVNPIIGNSFGLSSVLFLVAWHFMLYMTAELIEFSPVVAEWLGWRRAHRLLEGMTVGAVILGVTLSTLHQSGLGALYLMAEPKIHPLWYSEFLPLLFFVSSIFGGLAMVIVEGSISRRVFASRTGVELEESHDRILYGLARIAAGAMFVYLFLELFKLIHGRLLPEITGSWGAWYLVEILGLVGLPMMLLIHGCRTQRLGLLRVGAGLALLGIIVNRLNVAVIAYRWDAAVHYLPTWMELVVTLGVLSAELWVFRWIVHRMPVLGDRPEWAESSPAEHSRSRRPSRLAA